MGRFHREVHEEQVEMSGGSRCCFSLLTLLAEVLLFGSVALVVAWCLKYRGGFAWTEDPNLQFNLHPVLMVSGFIFFAGHAMLTYRQWRCCNHSTIKLVHTLYHIMAIPCIAVGLIAVFDFHNNKKPTPIPNLYSLHSWMGLVTVGLYGLQVLPAFIVGFFSFLFLLCCDTATASFRAALVPVHSSFGITTFFLAVATCLTGLTEKVLFTIRDTYQSLGEEPIVVNVFAMCLVLVAIVMSVLLLLDRFRQNTERLILVSRQHEA
ncbi:probable ascorbate-specific transmembrane electron transporter 1 isoform X1 [Amphibalanus amphitrite]|uniref:probable ascorbate-specific transmembrane electron transporter 1 isoform X1 n=1 Tax=Amphibalanus amphitrite TaxID=1232801 RepID=UPI001C927045|nr:probable ascorbate-specific transmembrane electron transporter 1 isoform X1 [Amphibalanus amphitrite]XP_043247019.1 probable ascorbate-specific transmembrane electron transporter 1 isoform X1 [Amphibalanus amphitrite]